MSAGLEGLSCEWTESSGGSWGLELAGERGWRGTETGVCCAARGVVAASHGALRRRRTGSRCESAADAALHVVLPIIRVDDRFVVDGSGVSGQSVLRAASDFL